MNRATGVPSTQKSRRAIFDRLHGRVLDVPKLPDVDDGQLVEFDDREAKFQEMLEFVGGQLHRVEKLGDVETVLNGFQQFQDATRIASLQPQAVRGNMHVDEIDDPHALSTMDWAVVSADFAVAENGAVWISGQSLPHRVMLFITQFLAILVPRQSILDNMHQAYRRIGSPKAGFGVFVSGPSKTADIEQSLVLGAHGCRNLHVFLVP